MRLTDLSPSVVPNLIIFMVSLSLLGFPAFTLAVSGHVVADQGYGDVPAINVVLHGPLGFYAEGISLHLCK